MKPMPSLLSVVPRQALAGLCALVLCASVQAQVRAFDIAGGDLKQRNGMTDEQWQAQHLIFERQVRAMLACQPSVGHRPRAGPKGAGQGRR